MRFAEDFGLRDDAIWRDAISRGSPLLSVAELLTVGAILCSLYVVSTFNYVLFHSLVAVVGTLVALTVSLVTLTAHQSSRMPYLSFIGLGYVFVGLLDMLHMLSFNGMHVFTDYDYYAPQFWLAARFLEGTSVLLAMTCLSRGGQFSLPVAFAGFSVVTIGLTSSILYFHSFPVCFIPGHGLTPFKIYAEYALCVLILVDIFLFHQRRHLADRRVYLLIQAALVLMIGMELCFTLYGTNANSDISNGIGHLLQVCAFLLIYKAVVVTVIRDPIDLLFRDLKASHEALRVAKESAERGFRNEQLLMGAIVESSQDAIFTFDQCGGIMNWNRGAERLFGYARDEIVGQSIRQLLAAQGGTMHEDWLKVVASGKALGNQHATLTRRDGKALDVSISISPLQGDDGVLLGASTIVRDTSHQRAAERALARDQQRLATILRTASDGIHILDRDGRLIQANDAFLSMLGYDASAVGTLRVTAWDAILEWPAIKARNDELIAARGRLVFETVHRHRDGRLIDVEISATGIEIEGNGYLYAASRDITLRKQLEVIQSIAAVAFDTQLGMTVTDPAGTVLRINRAYSQITGYTAEDMIGHTYPLLSATEADAETHQQIWAALRAAGSWQGETPGTRKSGEQYYQRHTVTAVRNDITGISHYVASLADITEQKSAEQEIHSLAFYDPLTGLPNRRLLMDRLRHAAAASARHAQSTAILFIDLDHFKSLNDSVGHDQGDSLLKQVARILKESVRETDTVARLGGDEFVVMVTELSASSTEAAGEARAVAEKILACLGRTYEVDGMEHRMSASIGITFLQTNGEAFEEPLKRADLAMYKAKAAGRNAIRFFDQ